MAGHVPFNMSWSWPAGAVPGLQSLLALSPASTSGEPLPLTGVCTSPTLSSKAGTLSRANEGHSVDVLRQQLDQAQKQAQVNVMDVGI